MNTTDTLLLSLSALCLCIAPPAWAHAALVDAVPGKNTELTAAPKEITLRFNESLEADFSSIQVVDAGGKSMLTKKASVDASDLKTLRAPLDPLKSGRYTVQWVGVGHDGHRRTGDYRFVVK